MSFKHYRYFLLTLDPVHVGTGGTSLGRVDMSIVREPGTKLPKIPGTSLHGMVRQYAAQRYGKPRCAGQGQPGENKEGHCGQPTCPICYTFGAITGKRSYAGVVSISDARILLFPVYSMVGPVWVTSPAALYDAGFGEKKDGELVPFKVDKDEQGAARWDFPSPDHINLGWLMVKKENGLPKGLISQAQSDQEQLPSQISQQIRDRIVLVSDRLFSQIVNSNLEVRTSVAINPETGAAEDKALFTYEAVPRATVLWMDVVVDDYRGEFPNKNKLDEWDSILCTGDEGEQKELLKRWRLWEEKNGQDAFEKALGQASAWLDGEKFDENGNKKWLWERQEMRDSEQSPKGIVVAGLQWAEHLGIGGMGTRGFGRIRKVAEEVKQ